MIIRAAQLGASMFQRNIVYSQNSPGLGLGRVRSCTMCSWYLPFPFCRTFLQKRKQISNKKLSSSNNSCNFGSNSCFLLKKRACEGGCQGAPGKCNSVSFSHIWSTFCIPFFGILFSHKIEIVNENCPQNKPKVDTFGSCFQKMKENRKVRFDCTGAYGLHMSPHRGAPRATQNYTKKPTDSRNLFFLTKNDTQKVSKWVSLFRANVPWAPLGSPLLPQSIF